MPDFKRIGAASNQEHFRTCYRKVRLRNSAAEKAQKFNFRFIATYSKNRWQSRFWLAIRTTHSLIRVSFIRYKWKEDTKAAVVTILNNRAVQRSFEGQQSIKEPAFSKRANSTRFHNTEGNSSHTLHRTTVDWEIWKNKSIDEETNLIIVCVATTPVHTSVQVQHWTLHQKNVFKISESSVPLSFVIRVAAQTLRTKAVDCLRTMQPSQNTSQHYKHTTNKVTISYKLSKTRSTSLHVRTPKMRRKQVGIIGRRRRP